MVRACRLLSLGVAPAVFALWLLAIPSIAASRSSADEERAAKDTVSNYHQFLLLGDGSKARESLSDELVMFNGGSSDDPRRWQAHLYLTGERLDAWLSELIEAAGPHSNEHEFVSTHIRGNAALVVTTETGSNRFRSWENEQVVYMLGRKSGGWKIVGLFIRDAENPE